MKKQNAFAMFVGLVALIAVNLVEAYPGESIVLDPVTGNYIITYWDDSTEDSYGNPIKPELMTTIFVPATKIVPSIQSKFRQFGEESVRYDYTVSNGNTAKQAIVIISLEQTGRITNEQEVRFATATEDELEQAIFANMSALDSHDDWTGYIRREQARIYWEADDLKRGGVRAGRTQSGFGFHSLALPGVGEARMEGLGAVFGYTGGGPAEDSAIRGELERLENNDFVSRNTAVPTIVVPEPFDTAVTLDRVRAHVATWAGKQLLDSTFASQLDRYLASAADACRYNQPKAAKEHIETLRRILKKEYEDVEGGDEEDREIDHKRTFSQFVSIDRLAARVLDFDLRYVLKRTEQGHDKDGRKEDEHRKDDPRKR